MRLRLLGPAVLTLFLGVAPAFAGTVDYTDALGNEWRDLTETLGFSWTEVDAVCANDGASTCSGSIGTVEFSGWVWATQDQVFDLFREITGLTTELDDFHHVELDSAWAPAALSHFTPTSDALTTPFIHGWTATAPPVGPSAFSAFLHDQCCESANDFVDSPLQPQPSSHHTQGVWLFRSGGAPIPEPSAALLFGAGSCVVATRLRRRVPPGTARPTL
jgi:hypothetical protein